MIELYLGAVGSGKSYHALRRGIRKVNCLDRNIVVANFPIKYSKRKKKGKREKENWLYMDEFNVDDLIRISIEKKFIGKENFALLIVDEAGIKFNSRDWMIAPAERKKWIKFFSQSRKFGYDVVLVAQDERMIDRQIRAAAEYRVMHRMLNRFSFFKLLPFKVFAYISYWSGGSFRGKMEMDMLLPWIANRYDSMKLFDISELAQYGYEQDEEVITQGFGLLQRFKNFIKKNFCEVVRTCLKKLMFLYVSLFFCLLMFLYYLQSKLKHR